MKYFKSHKDTYRIAMRPGATEFIIILLSIILIAGGIYLLSISLK